MNMYYMVWKYQAETSKVSEFEKEYSRHGTWFQLFEACDDFLGLELIKNTEDGSYLVIDKWISKNGYEEFINGNKQEVDRLNEICKSLYSSEVLLGGYDLLAQ